MIEGKTNKQNQAIELYETGMSTKEIAIELHVGATTIKRWLKQLGINMRDNSEGQKASRNRRKILGINQDAENIKNKETACLLYKEGKSTREIADIM